MVVEAQIVTGPRYGLGVIALYMLAACAGQHTATSPAVNDHPTAAASPLDASYDWHGLVVMPFGTLLKESPLALHEVLLFQDDSHASSEPGKDCYAVDGKPPRLADQEPEKFLLCFSHDRLDRIEATVHLQGDAAAQVFARACSLWLKGAALPAGVEQCEGHDGDTAFSAYLGRVSGEPAALSVVLLHSE